MPNDSDYELEFFEDALTTIFDDVIVSHGQPGEYIDYQSRLGAIKLKLTITDSWEEQLKFSHFIWNAELNLAKRIEAEEIKIKGLRVLELGAGAGLCGILSALYGAEHVVLSDYPAPSMMQNLEVNVRASHMGEHCSIVPHTWGDNTTALTQEGLFDVVLLGDCLWMPEQHIALCKTLQKVLSRTPDARIYCVAGFHSGRQRMAPFFEHLKAYGLIPDAPIFEQGHKGQTRSWDPIRAEEDSVERKRWLSIANLKWENL